MSKKRAHKPVISEAKLRRIIRDELARGILMREGILDVIKQPFQKLAGKAKEWVLEKSTELAKKVSEALASLQVPSSITSFLDSLKQQEGGADAEQLIAALPFADEINDLKQAADTDIASMLTQTTESMSYEDARLGYILAEEKYAQNVERLAQRLNEIAIISTWYAVSKTIITTASLMVFAIEGAAKLAEMLGFKKVAHFLEGAAEKIEHVEEWLVAKVIFPAPVQYAAYLAFMGGKKVVTKSSEKILSFKEFQAPENKEMKETTIKGLKIALLAAVVIEALAHIGHALVEFLKNVKGSALEIAKGAKHAGLEARGIAKTGAEISRGRVATVGAADAAASSI